MRLSAQNTTVTPGRRDAPTVGVGVLDVAREAARVVDEQDVERAGLGVADHAREVRPAQGVLARHEVEVLEPGGHQTVALREAGLLGALDVGPVAVGLPLRRFADIARPRAPREVLGTQIGGSGQAHRDSFRVSRSKVPDRDGPGWRSRRGGDRDLTSVGGRRILGLERGLDHHGEDLGEPRRDAGDRGRALQDHRRSPGAAVHPARPRTVTTAATQGAQR